MASPKKKKEAKKTASPVKKKKKPTVPTKKKAAVTKKKVAVKKKTTAVKKTTPKKKVATKKPRIKKPTATEKKVAVKKKTQNRKNKAQEVRSGRVTKAVKKAARATVEKKVPQFQTTPEISIIIPVYNEENLINQSIPELIEGVRGFNKSFEVILSENGSTDRTAVAAKELEKSYKELKMISVPEANYGRALRQGILVSKGKIVICDEIDLCNIDFYQTALEIIENEGVDFVIGSKLIEGSQDNRPLVRHLATHIINGILKIAVGLKGTDTHGLKAFKRERLLSVLQQCIVENDLFASEFVIRAEREGVLIREIPVTIEEKRPPSINLVNRVPKVLANLVRLTSAIRLGKSF